jgi:hypothetical protein
MISDRAQIICSIGKRLEVLVDGAPSSVVPANTPWRVHLQWEISGALAPFLTGSLNIDVYLESPGGSFEARVGAAQIDISAGKIIGPDRRHYQMDIEVSSIVPPGAYELVALIRHTSPDGTPGTLAGSSESVLVHILPPADLDKTNKAKSNKVDTARERYATLIDKKFLHGLSANEEKELEQINAFLDDQEAHFYEPAKKKLMSLHDQLLAQSSQPRPKEE